MTKQKARGRGRDEFAGTIVGEIVKGTIATVAQMRRAGAAPREILAELVDAAEKIAGPGCVASILLVGEDGLLRNGSSPNLPADYLTAIDGLKPDARVGTCAAAAATGTVILTPDFLADDKWAELRHLPLALGFAGAWSVPIKGKSGRVLGTFGTYFPTQRSPLPDERTGVERLARVAAEVLSDA